jgi:hypothetical protein
MAAFFLFFYVDGVRLTSPANLIVGPAPGREDASPRGAGPTLGLAMQLGLAAHWQLHQDLPTNHPRIVTRQVRSVLDYGACKYVRIVYIVLCAPNPICKAFFVQGKPFTRSVARMQAAGRNPGRSAKGTTSNCEGQPCDGLCQVDAFPGRYLTPFA